jgi:hypothetical protein
MKWAFIGAWFVAANAAWGQDAQQPVRPGPTAQAPAAEMKPAAPRTTQPARDPRLEVTPAEFHFGEIWAGSVCKREFTLKNVGTEPLKLLADSTCGCTVPTQPKSPLEPGESCTFAVTYDTKRVGAANKKVTLRLADTRAALWEIPVEGNVKPVYAATPPSPITFEGLEANDVATKTIKLENKYNEPVSLKLVQPKSESPFDIQLKEIKPGMEYELAVTTKPPLHKGFNRGQVLLETGLEGIDKLEFHVSANIQPRVITTPMRLTVPPDLATPTEATVRVQYRTDKPVKVLDVRTNEGAVEWELLPAPALSPTAKLAAHQVRVVLPLANQLPPAGAELIITTDDPSPEFQTLKIPIGLGPPTAAAPARTPQPQRAPAPADTSMTPGARPGS